MTNSVQINLRGKLDVLNKQSCLCTIRIKIEYIKYKYGSDVMEKNRAVVWWSWRPSADRSAHQLFKYHVVVSPGMRAHPPRWGGGRGGTLWHADVVFNTSTVKPSHLIISFNYVLLVTLYWIKNINRVKAIYIIFHNYLCRRHREVEASCQAANANLSKGKSWCVVESRDGEIRSMSI